MLGVARQRVQEHGLHNVKLVLGGAQVFDFEPSTFDLATSRMGVMFFANPTAAFRNIGGALKPGGRLTFACWGPPQENRHWLISYDIALRHLGIGGATARRRLSAQSAAVRERRRHKQG
jgi:ubiquinone/menaquinone biosynthesis C-methylase UbiE